MSSRALVTQPIDLKPHPLPYGRLSLGATAWDQLQALKAYEDGDERHERPPAHDRNALDKKV